MNWTARASSQDHVQNADANGDYYSKQSFVTKVHLFSVAELREEMEGTRLCCGLPFLECLRKLIFKTKNGFFI